VERHSGHVRPRGLPAGRNLPFHNDGHGKFTDVSEVSGVGKPTGCESQPDRSVKARHRFCGASAIDRLL